MNHSTKTLSLLAKHSHTSALALQEAVEHPCRLCVSQISEWNRQTLSELSDAERLYSSLPPTERPLLAIAYRLADCVHRAFFAAMLLPEELPRLPPLLEVAACNSLLAQHALTQLQSRTADCFSMHLCANKGRGAHAVLLASYCTTEGGRALLPLALALEAHRNALERACEEILLHLP